MSSSHVKERLARISGADNTAGATSKPVVVLVDDDEQVIRALTLVLQNHYAVRSFSNPDVGAHEGAKPDVAAVILDIVMPIHDGFWVYEEIKKRNTKVPIIFNSAYQGIRTEDQVRALKPFSWLSKTGNVKEFLQTVAAAVALSQGK